MNSTSSNPLCLECGLCCNGVIFANGQLQPGDDAKRLESLGLGLLRGRSDGARCRKFVQPCAALEGCRCRIYGDRPEYCREFECLLLQRVNTGAVAIEFARDVIRTARRRAETVRRLLRQLGDADERVALSVRFRRLKKRLESNLTDEETADLFGRLTMAVHELNLILSAAFYSEPRG